MPIPMQAMQVRATELQDASAAQLEAMRARARELRLRSSDLQAREQQLRELRFQPPPGLDRLTVDKQWLDARHHATAATIELEGLNERIAELRKVREETRAVAQVPPPALEPPPPVEVRGFANVGIGMVILFIAPILIVLVYRLWTRGTVRDPVGLEASPRFQRMEQSIELIAMEVERIAEGQRFTTRILAERHPDVAPRVQATPREEPGTIAPL
jgi:hypothetical protein